LQNRQEQAVQQGLENPLHDFRDGRYTQRKDHRGLTKNNDCAGKLKKRVGKGQFVKVNKF
jgi:hypothetical protein